MYFGRIPIFFKIYFLLNKLNFFSFEIEKNLFIICLIENNEIIEIWPCEIINRKLKKSVKKDQIIKITDFK